MGNMQEDHESRFELAYRIMLSELVPLFLHELNNPLTALATLPEMLRGTDWRNQIDQPFKFDAIRTLKHTNELVSSLSDSLNKITRAGLKESYAHILPYLHAFSQLLSPRFRKNKMKYHIEPTQAADSVVLPPRKLSLLVYAVMDAAELYVRKAAFAAEDTITFRVAESRAGQTELQVDYPPSAREALVHYLNSSADSIVQTIYSTLLRSELKDLQRIIAEAAEDIVKANHIAVRWYFPDEGGVRLAIEFSM